MCDPWRNKAQIVDIVIEEACNNKAGYTATLVACGWAGAVLEKVTRAFGQEPYAQQAQPVAQGQYVVSDTRCPALYVGECR